MTENPFIHNGKIGLEASINKVMLCNVKDIVEDNEIEGKSAFDIFSTGKIIEEIKRNREKYGFVLDGLNDWELPIKINEYLECGSGAVLAGAEKIAEKFGKRLGVILYVLRRGQSSSNLERKDWNKRHWDYWQTIERVILTGGLSSGTFGKQLKRYAEEVTGASGIKPLEIIVSDINSNGGIRGAAHFISERKSANMVFDFGQTFLKRGFVKFADKNCYEIVVLPKMQSRYMSWDENVINKSEAVKLNIYLLRTILNTYDEMSKKGMKIGEEIVISIANYVKDGIIINRGGYGKLLSLSPNYQEYLAQQLFDKTGKRFKIKMIHDGTAIAANFTGVNNSVSISMGTAFGIGFPEEAKKLIMEV